jgi:hypothetical protein
MSARMLEANEDGDAYLRSARVSGLLIIPQGFAEGTDREIPIFVAASMNAGPDSSVAW